MLKSAPHPNAAQVLANFMVTAEGQAALNTGYASVLKSDGSVANASAIALPDPAELTPEKVKAYQQDVGSALPAEADRRWTDRAPGSVGPRCPVTQPEPTRHGAHEEVRR